VTTCTATAPEAVRTLRTNRETTPEGFHDQVPSDHITPEHKTNQQVSDLSSHPGRERGTSQARIAVLLGVWQVGSSSVLGAGLILGATACYGFGTMYTRLRFSHTHVAPLVLPALQLVCATVVLIPFVAVAPRPTTLAWGPALALLGLGLGCTGLAYVLFWRVIGVVGATVAASSTYLIPLVSTALGVLALHESLAWYEPVGGAIVLLGVALTQRAATRQARFEASVDVERALAIWGE